MTLRPSRVVGQMRGIPFFVGKSSSTCSVCGRPLTAHESVARGIGPVCVRKHMGPGAHPSGSPQSVHAGRRTKRKGRKPLSELVKMRPASVTKPSTGVETTYVNDYGEEGKVLYKINDYGSAESELMAYEFSESIDWGIVPETILPEGTKDVSVQRWVEGETFAQKVGVFMVPAGKVTGKSDQIVVMDSLLGNKDRHGDNILIDAEDKQWAIDNNLALGGGVWESSIKAKTYASESGWSAGPRVPKDRAGLIGAAKDVAKWYGTLAFEDYMMRLERTHGSSIAQQFEKNVLDLAEWSEQAKVVE